MEGTQDARYESFNDYPWLDYKKYKDTWLLVMGAGSNAQNQHCILTQIDDNIHRAIITQEIYDMIMSHDGPSLQIRYTFDSDEEVYVELQEVSQGS